MLLRLLSCLAGPHSYFPSPAQALPDCVCVYVCVVRYVVKYHDAMEFFMKEVISTCICIVSMKNERGLEHLLSIPDMPDITKDMPS